MFPDDLKQSPGAPIGINWEINLDEHDEYFFLELIHESRWQMNAEHSRVRQETITEFFACEFDSPIELVNDANQLTEKFKQGCLIVVEKRNN